MNEVVSLVLTFKDGATQTITVTQNTTMEPELSPEDVITEETTEAAPVEESAEEVVDAPTEEVA